MEVKWDGKPSGVYNKSFEVDAALVRLGDLIFRFTLCRKQDVDDPHEYRVWCANIVDSTTWYSYSIPGTIHGHIDTPNGTLQECYDAVAAWIPTVIERDNYSGTETINFDNEGNITKRG